ncbi:MAG: hypothetical protein JWR47_268 [Phenylobacterium sp.]|nr:hypothetical protein [Phenylobacterium sp.]
MAADGEKGWLDGGFGKTSASGAGPGHWKGKAQLSDAALEWRPRLNFAVSGLVSAHLQPDTDPKLDLGEAYVKLQGPPSRLGKWSARVGVFYPPVSMEHEGVAWTNPDMLTSSAINSWIGEEVKVGGVEATVSQRFGGHEVSATGAVFGFNDTSGTLLSFRGWALGDVQTGTHTDFQLPPLSPFMVTKQAAITTPFIELDDRAGYYGRLEWRPPAPVRVNVTYYDNVGNRIAVKDLQWAWETHFLNVGVEWEPDDRTRLAAQGMTGKTLMGYTMPGGIWLDVDFQAAYLLAQRRVAADTFSGRIDTFRVRDRTFRALDDNSEHGWAYAVAWRHPLAPHADLVLEALHVSSRRPARVLAAEDPRQDQTVLQSALRLSF